MAKRWCGYCPERNGRCAVCNGTGIGPTHDAYGNPYGDKNRCHHCGGDGNCIVCNGTKRHVDDCKHGDLTAYPKEDRPIVYCNDCGDSWIGILSGTRIHSGMYDILKDAVLTGRDQDAIDIMNQYLDWRPSSEKKEIASEKQWGIQICPYCGGDNCSESRVDNSISSSGDCFWCHGLGVSIQRPIGSGG